MNKPAETVSEQIRRARAEESLDMIMSDLDWMAGKLRIYAATLTKGERGQLRLWLEECLAMIPAEKDPLS